jgi:hypothetical protein
MAAPLEGEGPGGDYAPSHFLEGSRSILCPPPLLRWNKKGRTARETGNARK